MFAPGDFVRVTESLGMIGSYDPVLRPSATNIMFRGAPAIVVAVDPDQEQSEISSADGKQMWMPNDFLELIQECP